MVSRTQSRSTAIVFIMEHNFSTHANMIRILKTAYRRRSEPN
jgi:hypothetical protein